ncbi:MAG: hypothetical protein DCC59_13400 [Chloroflexi bacterium]|nr:hypothetical protein [Anaerolineales bacterium]RIK50515.1 MAG: hypothetical protein DCC59_13400 [Chloroflexota bacterium]
MDNSYTSPSIFSSSSSDSALRATFSFKCPAHADVSSACKNSGPLPPLPVNKSLDLHSNTAFAASTPETVTPATP